MKENRLKKTYKTIKIILTCLKKCDSGYILAMAISSVVNTLIRFPYVFIPGMIINELTNGKQLVKIVALVGIIVSVSFFERVFNAKWNQFTLKKEQKLQMNLLSEFFSHTADIEYAKYEEPDFLDLCDRVKGIYERKIINTVRQMSALISSIMSLIGMASIVTTLSPIMILAVLLPVVVNTQISKRMKCKQYENDKAVSSLRRKMSSAAVLEKPYIVEVKLFNLKNFFINMFEKAQTDVDILRGKLDGERFKAEVGNRATGLFEQSFMYIYLIYCVVRGTLSIGSMTIYMSAVSQLSNAINSLINSYLNISANNLWIDEFVQYNTLAEVGHGGNLTPVFDRNSVIEFKNVTFSYPGSDRCVIDKLNLVIRGDEKLSIVGENGSGKTTFVKLLMGLYDPTEGEILLNGVNIHEYDCQKYRRLFASVFQDSALFYFSIAENIILASKLDEEKLDKIVHDSGLDTLVNKLPKRYDTQVYKTYDETGITPSGGEAQKIAIARACYHGGNIFILDEPTASLDPLSEYKIYKQFNNMIEDKAAIIITHRLSAVKLANRIAVFENGHVIEYGTHTQLYEKNGVYRKMYDRQSEFYLNEDVIHEE